MKRKKTVSKYTLYLITGNTVEILADKKKELNTEEATEFWRDNHYVGKFNNNSFFGFILSLMNNKSPSNNNL